MVIVGEDRLREGEEEDNLCCLCIVDSNTNGSIRDNELA